MTGQTKAPPPEIHRAVPSPPTWPEMTSTRFAGHRRYREAKNASSPVTRMTAAAGMSTDATGRLLVTEPCNSGRSSTEGIGVLEQLRGVNHDEGAGMILVDVDHEDGTPRGYGLMARDSGDFNETFLNR